MDTQVKISVDINATVLPPSAGLMNRVFITLRRTTDEFIQDPSGFQTLIGSYPSSPTHFITLNLRRSSPRHIRQLLYDRLRDPELCQHLALKIASVATQIGFGLQGFFMYVHASLTEERLFFASGSPSRGAPEAVVQRLVRERTINIANLKNWNFESTTCSICLEEFMGSDSLVDMPCSHVFHDHCVLEWLKRQNSCPLCRRVPYGDAPE